jgi:hypothetical protein
LLQPRTASSDQDPDLDPNPDMFRISTMRHPKDVV